MAKSAWVKRFVRQNIVLLTGPDGAVDLIKRKKRQFVGKHSLRSGDTFTNREVAQETLSYLLETRRIVSEEDLQKAASSSPFLLKYLHERDIAEVGLRLRDLGSAVIAPEDLSKLSQAEFIHEKTEELKEEAVRRAEVEIAVEREKIESERARLQELAKHVEERRKELDRVASELDRLPDAINPEEYVTDRPEEEPVPPGGRALLWWEKLGLAGDPFPTKLGLNRIPQEKYDDVVVLTEVFKQYLQLLARRPRDLFGKTILITGEFGSGKTTFFQYLSYKSAGHRILPIQVILDPVSDSDLLRENLYSAIFDEVSTASTSRGLPDPRAGSVRLNVPSLLATLNDLAEASQVTGLLLTIDGLHKAESTLDSALEFLKQLQNFHENLDSHGINMAILVAGSPLWMRRLSQNPSYSGSFYRVDEISDLSPEGAFKLLQNRLKAFESDSGIPVFLDRTAIEFAYQEVASQNGGRVTFRSFIDYVLPRLERGEYEHAGITVEIDREVFEKIHLRLLESGIADSYELYRRHTSGKSRLLKSCRVVLEAIYKQGYVQERDELFQRNKGAFWTLNRCRLIQKVRAKSKAFGWGFTKDFLAVLENLNEQGIPPEIVFRSFSMDPERLPLVAEERDDPTLTAAQDFLGRWEAEWPELAPLVGDFISSHEDVPAALLEDHTDDLCEGCQSALRALIAAAQTVMDSSLPPDNWVEETWVDLSAPETIMSVLKASTVDTRQKYDFVTRYNEGARLLLEVLDDLLKAQRVVNLTDAPLGKEDLQGLMSAAVNLEAGELARAVDELNTRIEKKTRTAFHLALSLHYGPDYESHLPEGVQRNLERVRRKRPESTRSSVDSNRLYLLSRGEYAELVKSRDLWEPIFQPVFAPRDKETVVAALQRTFSLDTRRAHRESPIYFRRLREETRKAIVDGMWLLEALDNAVVMSLRPPGILKSVSRSEVGVQISFRGQRYVTNSFKWTIFESAYREIQARIARRPAPVDLSAESMVRATLGHSLPVTCLVAADLCREGQIDFEFVDGKMRVRFLPQSPEV